MSSFLSEFFFFDFICCFSLPVPLCFICAILVGTSVRPLLVALSLLAGICGEFGATLAETKNNALFRTMHAPKLHGQIHSGCIWKMFLTHRSAVIEDSLIRLQMCAGAQEMPSEKGMCSKYLYVVY